MIVIFFKKTRVLSFWIKKINWKFISELSGIEMNFYLPTKDIYSLAVKGSLPTTQFDVLRQILDKSLLTTEDGISLRKLIIDTGYMDVILNCLSIVTHNSDLCDELAEKKTDFKRPGKFLS